MRLSKRLDDLPPYLFREITRKIAEKKARGEEVISFAIGDPDTPTPQRIIDSLCKAAREPSNHQYPESDGLPELRRAISKWYEGRFGVTLDPEREVLPLIGAKEGVVHAALCFLDPEDIALVPDPGYPPYAMGTILADGKPYYLPLTAENDFLPNLEAVPREIAQKAKMIWINYPNNPTGAVASLDFFNRVIEFTRKYDIAVCHDGPYTEIAFDDYQPPSFLEGSGALDTGIEFHSLSKTYNMTGWRIGMAVGNSEMIDALKRVKSNVDSGIPQAIQYAAIDALTGPQDITKKQSLLYQRRRDLVVDMLGDMGLEVKKPKAGLYVWTKIPPGYTSLQFANELLEKVGVVVTPGIGYGKYGEGYVRLSLTISDARLVKGLSRLAEWQIR